MTTPDPLRAAAEAVLFEFDYWVGPPRPAIDGGTVRIHKFNEVQPDMERALDALRAALAADPLPSGEPGEPYQVPCGCPTCYQPMPGDSMRSLADAIGLPHTVVWRFLRGKDMQGRNLDKVAAYLEPRP